MCNCDDEPDYERLAKEDPRAEMAEVKCRTANLAPPTPTDLLSLSMEPWPLTAEQAKLVERIVSGDLTGTKRITRHLG